MAPLTLVKSAMLPDIPHQLQQLMSKNTVNLENTNICEYLLWMEDAKKIVNKVTRFVHSYQLKTKMAHVRGMTMDFSTLAISRVIALPDEGVEFDKPLGMGSQRQKRFLDTNLNGLRRPI